MARYHFDVAVVGSGAAGLMAAAVAGESCSVVVVTDRGFGTSNSAVAQGGLQFPEPSADSVEMFRRDMKISGGPSVDEDRLAHFVASAHDAISQLQKFGLELDRDADGSYLKLTAGGVSEPRIVTSGDRIGPAILKVLRSRVTDLDVDVRTRTTVGGLAPDGRGGWSLDTDAGVIHARSVIIATGGRSFEFAADSGIETSNPSNANGAMHRVLRRLGIGERDPDLFQYHPYGLIDVDGRATGKCMPESIVAFGGFAADAGGRRLTAPGADRATITAAMRRCLGSDAAIRRGDATACRLAMSDVDLDAFLDRYHHVGRTLSAARLDDGDLCVRPIVHYQLGGFDVQPSGETTLPGLFLAGEVTGGLHGRNRLMGNGITEAVVDGWTAGRAAVARTSNGAHDALV